MLGAPGQHGLLALRLELGRLAFVGGWPQANAPDQVEQQLVRGFPARAGPAAASLGIPGPRIVRMEHRTWCGPEGAATDLVAVEVPPGAQDIEAALCVRHGAASVHCRPRAPSSVLFRRNVNFQEWQEELLT